MRDALEESGLLGRCRVIACDTEATDDALSLVHSPHYVRRLRSLERASAERLCDEAEQYTDMFLNEHSVACARLAAGGVCRMADALWAGTMHNGLALVRPAGHHAGVHGPSGFCLVNNLAVAARQLLARGCDRVMIVDWDVHHGDGTQEVFLDEDRVLVFSVHRRGSNVFPFGGRAAASPAVVGTGRGAGYNVNVAWEQGGMGDAEYAHAWDALLLPLVRRWRPQVVLVSAGFDAARGDPLGDCTVTPAGFGRMTRALAAETGGRLLLALEGGYSLKQLPACALACVSALLDEAPSTAELAADAAGVACGDEGRAAVQATLQAHATHWPGLDSPHATPDAPAPAKPPAAPREEGGRVTREEVSRLPDFAHVLPADYRSGYMAWRSGLPRGAKGELPAVQLTYGTCLLR